MSNNVIGRATGSSYVAPRLTRLPFTAAFILIGSLTAAARAASPPAPAPPAVRIPDDQPTVTVKLVRVGGLPFVRDVTLNGQRLGLVQIDTGLGCTLIDRKVADRLALRSRPLPGLSPGAPSPVRQLDSIALGGVSLGRCEVAAADVASAMHLSEPVDGTLGADPAAKAKNGQTLYDWARRAGFAFPE